MRRSSAIATFIALSVALIVYVYYADIAVCANGRTDGLGRELWYTEHNWLSFFARIYNTMDLYIIAACISLQHHLYYLWIRK